MTHPDNLRPPDLQHNHDISPSKSELSRSHFPIVTLGLVAIVATAATGYSLIERLKSNEQITAVDAEAALRSLAREAILSGPDSPTDIINTCNASTNQGAYRAMYVAVDDAIRNNVLPENVHDTMDRAAYVSIETSAVILNERQHNSTGAAAITLFYKDINSDGKREILATTAEVDSHAKPCRR